MMAIALWVGLAWAGGDLARGRALEAARAEAVVRGDPDASQREAQAGHAYHRVCEGGEVAACARLDALISARGVDADACVSGWVPACERLRFSHRARLCLGLPPDATACDVGARIIGHVPVGLRGLVPFGAQVDGHPWTDAGSERWVTAPSGTAVIGKRLYWIQTGTDASQVFRLTEEGLEDLGVVRERGIGDVVEDHQGRARVRRHVWEERRGEQRFRGFELIPLEGGRVQHSSAGVSRAGDTRVWYPADGVVAWGTRAGEELGRTMGRRARLSSDGSLVRTLPAADTVHAGSGLIALDGIILELEPGAWQGRQPPRRTLAQAPQTDRGDCTGLGLGVGLAEGTVLPFDPTRRYRRLDAPSVAMSGEALAAQAPVVSTSGRVVSRTGSKTHQWEVVADP